MIRWLVASVEFLFSLVVLFAIFAILKDNWTIHILILPLTIIPWSMLGLGIGMIAAYCSCFFATSAPSCKCC